MTCGCCSKKTVDDKEQDLAPKNKRLYECIDSDQEINSSALYTEIWGDPDDSIDQS